MSDNTRLKEIFNKALELPTEERAAFIEKECEGDSVLKREVEDLLSYHIEDTIIESGKSRSVKKKLVREGAFHEDDPTERLITNFRQAKSKHRSVKLFRVWILVSLVFLLIVGFLTYKGVKQSLLDIRKKELSNMMDANILSMKIWVQDQENFGRVIASVPRVRENVEYLVNTYGYGKDGNRDSIWNDSIHKELVQTLDPILNQLDFPGFTVMDRTGYNIAADSYKHLGGRVNEVGLKEFMGPIIQKKSKFIRPYFQREYMLDSSNVVFDEPITWMSNPVFDKDSNVIASLGVCLFADEGFSKILNINRVGRNGETYAFDAEGLLVSHTIFTQKIRDAGLIDKDDFAILKVYLKDPGFEIGDKKPFGKDYFSRPLTKSVSKALSEHKLKPDSLIKGYIIEPYRNYVGVEMIGAYAWLPEYGFGMITEISAKEAFAPLRYLNFVFITIFVFLFFFVGYSWYSRYTMKKLQLKIGEVIKMGQYTLEEIIGEGGMGQVYKARHAILKRPTAIKILKPEITSETNITRFRKEVQLASQLTHPNTIAIYDYGVNEEGTFYYAMEYLEGCTLSQAVRYDGRLEPRRVVHILKQICGSIAEAHRLGLVHRDIKPPNVMLCVRGGVHDFVKVLDFGLVKDYKNEEDITHLAHITGTPLFMAPERFTNPSVLDPRIDIYSIGALGYYLLTGVKAFDHSNQMNVMQKVLSEDPRPITDYVKTEDLPPGLDELILKCLAKDPNDRPETVEEMVYILEDIDMDPWTDDEAELWWDKNIAGMVF